MKVIILVDGVGTNLWPLSRDRLPKQFIKFQGRKRSLFQETFLRSLLLASLDDIYVVTNKNYEFLIMGAVEELGYNYPEENILVEPEDKNALPAIYAGVDEILKREKSISETIVVFPSDHLIKRSKKFIELIKSVEYLTSDSLITFGIKSAEPNTGHGYIAPGESKGKYGYVVKEFKEKPDYQRAVEYIKKGYFWNSGIFMFNSELFIEEAEKFTPEIKKAFQESKNLEEAFNKIKEKISIDYAIMEKSKRVVVIPADIGWNDLGNFDAFYYVFDRDEKGNVGSEEYLLLDSRNNLIHSEAGKLGVMVGVDDL
ncbi:MAG: sugar phosphate nucleotidyltransferase, partial [Atribacterota bacterium]|nr:sugar phosphate nucleotidyltransferase [Atribacterota bacterium]